MNVGEQLQERLNRMPPVQGRAWEERFIKELDEQAAANDYPADVSKTVPEYRPFRVKKRMAGLSKGAFNLADDFDDPLPDAFWLGER